MKTKTFIALLATGTAFALAMAGCSSTNRNQFASTTSFDGQSVNASVGYGGFSIGLSIRSGKANNTETINPTGTNVHSAPLAIIVSGHGKQGANGAAGTNSVAGITDGSHDTSAVIMGEAEAGDATNNVTASGVKQSPQTR